MRQAREYGKTGGACPARAPRARAPRARAARRVSGVLPLSALARLALAFALLFWCAPMPLAGAHVLAASATSAFADDAAPAAETGQGAAAGDAGAAAAADAGASAADGDTGGSAGSGGADASAPDSGAGGSGDSFEPAEPDGSAAVGDGTAGDGAADGAADAGGTAGGGEAAGAGDGAGASGDPAAGSDASDPDAGDPDASDPDAGDPDAGDPDAEGPFYVETLLLKWDKPDADGMTHFVGELPIVEEAYQQVRIAEYGEKVQLNAWYLSTDGTGEAYQAADSTTAIGAFNLTWASSDEGVASVSPSGEVTPHGKDGEVVITATVDDARVYQGSAPAASVTVVFSGQEGRYVKSVEILDDAGANIGEAWGGTTVYAEENTFHQLQARVTWYDVATGAESVEVTGQGEEYSAANVGTTLTWAVSASNAFSINEDTGRLRTQSYSGNAYVTCTAVGGKDGALVRDTANVQLDTGVYEYNPADSLTLRVVWEERPDEVVREQTFSLDELSALLPPQRVSATVVNNSRFGVISAEGYLFKDVVALVAVDDADVLQYRFGTADGYDNPVSYRYLFESGNRYYFPNYDVGGSRAEGQIVPPLLAYRSVFQWDRAEADPNWQLDEGTRFRLVFGCLATGDANTSYQIYYIHTITVVLKGAPSAGESTTGGDDDDPGDVPSGAASKKGSKKGGAGGGASGGAGRSGTGGTSAAGSIAGRSGNGAPQAAGSPNAAPGAERAADEQGGQEADAAAEEEIDEAQGDGADADASASKRWRVYQMMNKTNSDVPDWDDENPISPFAAPAALGAFAVGAGATGIGFRRRLK